MKDVYQIAVVHGDGIGPEVCAAAVEVVKAALGPGCPLRFTEYPAGAEHFLKTGQSFPQPTFEACRAADAILHGAGGLPGVIYPDGTEAGLDFTLRLRFELDLYANIRPIRLFEGVTSPLTGVKAGDIDYVILRENSEGLYAARGAGALLRGEVAVDTLVQTRAGIERIVRKAFELARQSNGAPRDGVRRVTCCDKANVLRSYAFFRSVFDEVAKDYPDIETEHALVDAMAMHLVLKPGHFNVIVSENMFGDILSDLAAATVGGMGMAPSAEVGDANGFFQAAHGSAPDIAGKGIANPYGTILSAAAMLDWLGRGHGDERLLRAAEQIRRVTEACLAGGLLSADLKGKSSTAEITGNVCDRLAA
ncbi:isocitrate/isopropylmalate dehydrogenase family protein [Mesorhizobium sp.]|uniref:isocitrate/isopropylmalate dehydrogenase family protein n=2 Tax=Mesorhizobium sp. TaxID=1871066 RepID=UPI000FE3A154|nr:isocitrate/isopropylmalate dehydrogenase family protein [Mesorhizobium sp.]RWH73603.1 MAG: isocitrate/isopropylmalate dehydrogenase family protein [Mesorhizobium sp.]RWL31270.1 MAG: isocitrate/isopropylmalate dehydrogenase family protein [Mesorhizobium sp.]RWL36668.1 MAG: isocitrate/isopropylmalate dehydrogenase family protein [Mesorhizobium sp.]RWL40572.1 MAG: isocitrate/isopropylmalate dehydrogenase family protein [Mesorhizobium sp.]RWL61337.1 MAG: isocitrate/isopropylmalate dehydrogenase